MNRSFHPTWGPYKSFHETATARQTSTYVLLRQALYHRLRRLHGLREEYAEMVHLCRACRCLFWKALGHPCSVHLARLSAEERQRYCVPIPPITFLTFFSL